MSISEVIQVQESLMSGMFLVLQESGARTLEASVDLNAVRLLSVYPVACDCSLQPGLSLLTQEGGNHSPYLWLQ